MSPLCIPLFINQQPRPKQAPNTTSDLERTESKPGPTGTRGRNPTVLCDGRDQERGTIPEAFITRLWRLMLTSCSSTAQHMPILIPQLSPLPPLRELLPIKWKLCGGKIKNTSNPQGNYCCVTTPGTLRAQTIPPQHRRATVGTSRPIAVYSTTTSQNCPLH